MAKFAYIHIPFCHHICHYCDFNKVFLKGQPVDEYIQSLLLEMKRTLEQFPHEPIETIFVGGGTPTTLTASQLDTLCGGINQLITVHPNIEYTFEANPGDLGIEKLNVLASHGVNRLSFGVQSFEDRLLEIIGRSHRKKEVYQAIEDAQKAGFSNISMDLIYALPTQTMNEWRNTIKEALSIGLPHYSGYSLIIETKTVFHNLKKKGQLPLPTEDAEADMFEVLIDEMNKHHVNQYEISNFAQPGYESKHNLSYWNNEEYYGFGAGAHGYLNGVRRSNVKPVNKYIQMIEKSELPLLEKIHLTKEEQMEEQIFLGLRKTEGISLVTFNDKFKINPQDYFSTAIQENIAKGLLEISNHQLRLTRKGRFLGNEVFQSFLG